MTYFVPHVWLMKVLIFTALIITLSILSKPLLYYYQRSQLDDISVTEFNTLRTQKVPIALIDVRSDSEYQTEHIPDAISIPVTIMEQKIDTVKELVANKRLVTYCSTGPRSYEALIILKKYQINGVNLKGGFEAWWQQANKSR
jgi:adenylyltransferase/sulfurtransferase